MALDDAEVGKAVRDRQKRCGAVQQCNAVSVSENPRGGRSEGRKLDDDKNAATLGTQMSTSRWLNKDKSNFPACFNQ